MSKENATLIEYSREIGPRVRDIINKKQILADFKTTDQTALELSEKVKEVQADLKAYVEKEQAELRDEIKQLEKELKEAYQACARATKDTDRPYTVAELKAYFTARNKPFEMGTTPPVKKVIEKGETFEELEEKLGPNDD